MRPAWPASSGLQQLRQHVQRGRASLVLSFLPMLPSRILLDNLLYETGQLTIPTDHVDPEQLRVPSHWDIAFIRRFMLFSGPVSSLVDFLASRS
ncbi:hypothetical protein [Streptomyces melanogenes]|uniref:hypothetical protein n=1 Tax=Streptomyces melanogenes TaxID=67326 RepID=UPI00379376A9